MSDDDDAIDPEVLSSDEQAELAEEYETYEEENKSAYEKGRVGRLPGSGFPKKKPPAPAPPVTILTTERQDRSIIGDLIAFSKEAKMLDRQRKGLKLIGPHSRTNILESDKPEIQILKELGKMYNDMNLEDQIAEEQHLRKVASAGKDNEDDPFFLDPDRIKEKRQHLEAMARNVKLISDHTQKVHATDGKLLSSLVKYRKEMADEHAATKAQQEALDEENDAIDGAIGKQNADALAHADLIAEAKALGLDTDAIMGSTMQRPEQTPNEDE